MFTLFFIFSVLGIAILHFLYTLYLGTFKALQKVHDNEFKNIPETRDQISLSSISGSIPGWLNGIMYRIGPGIFQIERNDGSIYSIKHGLDGLPFMHRFEISGKDQTVKYNSRLTAEALESSIKEKKNIRIMFFGHYPDFSFLNWLYCFFLKLEEYGFRFIISRRLKLDAQLIGVTATPNFPLPKKSSGTKLNSPTLVAKTDVNFMHRINPETLAPEELLSYDDYDSKLVEPLSCAHPQFDPLTGEVVNFTMRIAPLPVYKVFTISSTGETTILATMTHRKDATGSRIRAAYIHSFWMTKNYIIIPESPLYFSGMGMNNLLHGTAISSLKWDGNEPTYFHIISRNPKASKNSGLIASIPYHGFFHLHTANAYESVDSNGHVILNLDCSSFSDGDVIYKLHDFGIPRENCTATTENHSNYRNGIKMPPLKLEAFGDLCRYKLDLYKLTFKERIVINRNLDFPRFNQDYSLKEYKYLYGCKVILTSDKIKEESTSIVKVDLESGSSISYHQQNVICSEPIFVNNPNGISEDDGALITLANGKEGCYLLILDATNLKELSRFKVGIFNATTFHGSYVDHEFKSININ